MSYFDTSSCPNCRPGRSCPAHKGVVADGAVIRVPMMMRDSMQTAIAGRVNITETVQVRDQARIQASTDHFRERHAANDAAARATPAGNAYADMCADLQRGRC